jgi:hypothetical protein
MQIIKPNRKPDSWKVHGRDTMPEPTIVFQHVKTVVKDDYFFPCSFSSGLF